MSAADEALVQDTMKRYGLSEAEARLSVDRRKVYGDPKVNHDGIAMAWAGVLQPWARQIAMMQPVPAHVVALCMVGVKTNRQRMVFHKDNRDDANVYQAFASVWQSEYRGPAPEVIGPCPGDDYELVIEWKRKGQARKGFPSSESPCLETWVRETRGSAREDLPVQRTRHPIPFDSGDFCVLWYLNGPVGLIIKDKQFNLVPV